jgi:protein involved in temperature-dependent protein secretion
MSYPTLFTTPGVRAFAEEIDAERQRQLAKFGDQHHPDGTGGLFLANMAHVLRSECQEAADRGEVTWRQILMEECGEAFAETDPAALRTELLQVAAVCAAWIADIDSRPASPAV